jgi:hypothetical protein
MRCTGFARVRARASSSTPPQAFSSLRRSRLTSPGTAGPPAQPAHVPAAGGSRSRGEARAHVHVPRRRRPRPQAVHLSLSLSLVTDPEASQARRLQL